MKKGSKRFFTLLMFSFLSGHIIAQSTIYVCASATGGNIGTSWTNAYISLQSALDAAVFGDQIWVAKGTYKPSYDYGSGGGSRYYHFELKNGIAVYGGFAGTESTLNQRADFGQGEINETILSGDLNNNDVFDVANGGYQGTSGNDNCYHVLYNTNLTNTALIDGFTITGGNANGASEPYNDGAGMLLSASSPTIRNLVFTSNSSGNRGGAMHLWESSPEIRNCTFTENKSTHGGGVCIIITSVPVLTNCLFVYNYSQNGGAVECFNSSAQFTNTTFAMNTASAYWIFQ